MFEKEIMWYCDMYVSVLYQEPIKSSFNSSGCYKVVIVVVMWALTSHYIPSPSASPRLCGLIGEPTVRRPSDWRLVGVGASAVAGVAVLIDLWFNVSQSSNNWDNHRARMSWTAERQTGQLLYSRATSRNNSLKHLCSQICTFSIPKPNAALSDSIK